jgi:hypothetical protein
MADLSITPANVQRGDDAVTELGTSGAAATAGQVVYHDATDKRYKLSDNDAAATRRVSGVALNGAAIGQPLMIQKAGTITIGATMTPGEAYYLSDTPGGICPRADLEAGDSVILIGIAKSASLLQLAITDPGVTVPE